MADEVTQEEVEAPNVEDFNPLTITEEQLQSLEALDSPPLEENSGPAQDEKVDQGVDAEAGQDISPEDDVEELTESDLSKIGLDNDAIKRVLKNKHGKEKVKLLRRELLSRDKQMQVDREAQDEINREMEAKNNELLSLQQQVDKLKSSSKPVDNDALLAEIATDPNKALGEVMDQRFNQQNIQEAEIKMQNIRVQQANQQQLAQLGITLTHGLMDDMSKYLSEVEQLPQANINLFRANPYGESPSDINRVYRSMKLHNENAAMKAENKKLKGKSSEVLDKALDSAKAGPRVTGSAPTAASSGDANIPLSDEDLFNMSEAEIERLYSDMDKKSLHVDRKQLHRE